MKLTVDTVGEYLLFECVTGSKAYGLDVPQSDTDISGVFLVPDKIPNNNALFPQWFDLPQEVVQDEKSDTKFFRLDKFLNLASAVNPTVIELLFIQDDIRKLSPAMELLRANRDAFVSVKARDSFAGYAFEQIKKAKGQNKWVNNPQPEEIPSKLDFCYVIPIFSAAMGYAMDCDVPWDDEEEYEGFFPMRPIKLGDTDYDLSEYDAAGLEHFENTYRLYKHGKGVFRGAGQQLVTEAISKKREFLDIELILKFNEQEWKKAVKNWKQYWEWRKNRNEDRWTAQESGEMDYDAKNMMHCMRLLWSGINILEFGAPIIKFDKGSPRHQILMNVRRGKYEYDEIMKYVEEFDNQLRTMKVNVSDEIDHGRIENMYQRIISGEV